MTAKIHKLLKNGRWVLLDRDKKNPLEEAWVITPELYERGEGGAWINKKTKEPHRVKDVIYRRELHSYKYDDPKLIKHIENGGNIGYLCGSNGMYVVDIDTEGLLEVFEKLLGETLTFKSPKGYHLYVNSKDDLYKIVLEKDGEHIGELLGIGQQAVVWGSKNKEGREYELLKDLPVVELTNEKLILLKEKFTKSKIFEVKEPDWSQYKDVSGLDILSVFTAAKVVFPNVFLEYEEKNSVSLSPMLDDIEVKKLRWRAYHLEESLKLLKLFISKNFDLNLFDGRSVQKKGNHFERLVTHTLKAMCSAWIELGQIHQNKSVADGLGQIKSANKRYIFGLDAKLKSNSNYSKGLSSKERENQIKYINDLKKQAKNYGGLRSWLIVVKSEKDYEKFQNSIKKLKTGSKFNEIKLLAIEPLLKICEIYQKSLAEDVTNKDVFNELMYKLIRYKGDITLEKIKENINKMPKLQRLNFQF